MYLSSHDYSRIKCANVRVDASVKEATTTTEAADPNQPKVICHVKRRVCMH